LLTRDDAAWSCGHSDNSFIPLPKYNPTDKIMFSTLKLFSQIPCPDLTCSRSPCLFSHDPAVLATRASEKRSILKVDKVKVTTEPKLVDGVKRKAEETDKRPEAKKVNAHGVLSSGGRLKTAKLASTSSAVGPTSGNAVASSSKVSIDSMFC
jgi:hypothetical protein